MRRGFRDYAGQLKTKIQRYLKYNIFKRKLDDLISSNKPIPMLVTRKTYQSEVGQRMRNKGFLSSWINHEIMTNLSSTKAV